MFPTADALLARLREAGDPANVAGMARYGITTDNAFGVPMPVLRGIARELRADRKADPAGAHGLAQELWESGVHEGRILAPLVDVPSLVTREQARAWADDLDSWDVCDQLCSNLLGATPFAVELVEEWTGEDAEFVKRAGFVVICALTVHDKTAPDEVFLCFLPLVEREACDERNFVKKAVNWALRQIGKRDANLHGAAVAVALRLRESGSRAARWVASDALRELSDPKTVARIRA